MDKTLVQLDKVIGYHHVADDVETKVQSGPGGDVESYIKVQVVFPLILPLSRGMNILPAGPGSIEGSTGLLPQQQPKQRGTESSPGLL